MLEQALQRYENDSKQCRIETKCIDENQVTNAIRMLENGNVTNVDDGTGKRLIYGCSLTREWLYNLLNGSVKTASVPNHWNNGVIVPLGKGKDGTMVVNVHCTPRKLFVTIQIERAQEVTVCKIWQIKCTFIPGRVCKE